MDTSDERYTARENVWDEAWPETGHHAGDHPPTEADTADELAPFPEVAGTSDSMESVRDAEPYMAPTDPPVLPGGPEGIHVGVGFGTSSEEEAAGDRQPRGDEDIHDESLRALKNDSLTSRYPLEVDVRQGVVRLKGQVQSIEDAEHAASIVGNLPGVVDVVDETTLEPM